MIALTVTEEAVAALTQMSEDIQAAQGTIHGSVETLMASFEEYQDGLGPHAASILALLEETKAAEENAALPVKKLAVKLQRSAMIRKKLLQENPYERAVKSAVGATMAAGAVAGSGKTVNSAERPHGTGQVSSAERTIFELDTLESDLELTDGAAGILQVGGYDRDVVKEVKGQGYESHHIPPQSVFEDTRGNLPTIALTKEDHEKTSSFRGKMRHRYKPYIPGGNTESLTHKQNIGKNVDDGFLAEMIRNEIYEIREAFGSKYDGAIRKYLAAMKEYIRKSGAPKVMKSETSSTEQ